MSPEAISEIYSTDVLSGFDFYKPDFLQDLFLRYGDQGMSWFQTLRSMGFEYSTGLDTYGHFEENRTHETFRTRNTETAPGAGVDHTITIDQLDMDTNNKFYPRKWDEVLFPNETVGYISDVDTSTPADPVLTITPLQAADNLGAVSADDVLIIISSIFSEGSGQPASAVKGTFKYENDAQIIKETMTVTGTEMVNQTWFTQYGDDGITITGYYMVGIMDIDYRMNLKIDGALLFGKKVTNSNAVDPATGFALKGTEGLFPFVRSGGTTSIIADGAFAITDFDTIDRTLDQEGLGNYSLTMWGIKRHQEVENVLKPYFDNTLINYAVQNFNADIFKGDESKGATVNFSYFIKSERLFAFKRFKNLNNKKTYGAGGNYKMPQYGLVLPINKSKDPVSKKMINSIGCRYRALGNYSRRMEAYQVGGAGPQRVKVTEFDNNNTYMRAHIGAHYRGANQFLLVSPSI